MYNRSCNLCLKMTHKSRNMYQSKYICYIEVNISYCCVDEIYCRFAINRLSYHTTGWLLDMYRIYYIKNNYMFRHITLAIFRLRNEKNLVSSYPRLMCVAYSGEVRGKRHPTTNTELENTQHEVWITDFHITWLYSAIHTYNARTKWICDIIKQDSARTEP